MSRDRDFAHTPTRNACIASTPAVPWSCKLCILTATPLSLSSSLSCGTQASSDHRNPTACDRIVAFLARKVMPVVGPGQCSSGRPIYKWRQLTFPALYCVTLCCVCFLQSLPLQYVRRVLGIFTCSDKDVSCSSCLMFAFSV